MAKDWRNSRSYRVWRAQVVRRDKVCQICGSNKKREAHHKDSGAYFSEERFNVENGITLCRSCHTTFHTTFKKSFKEKCTIDDYKDFDSLADYFFEVALVNMFNEGVIDQTKIKHNKTKQNKETYINGRPVK